MAKKQYEFRPDPDGKGLLAKLYLTPLQRLTLLKWGLYSLALLACLLLQDVVFSTLRIYGGVAELAVCVILMVPVLQDQESGGLFALLGSIFYYFSGSAPGIYVIAVLPTLGICATIFRQNFLRRGLSSAWLCTGVTLCVYELFVFGVGLLLQQTLVTRWPAFLSATCQSLLYCLFLYPALQAISKIGGDAWKE